MIYDTLEHIELYRDVHPRIYQGLKLLEKDLSGLAPGDYPVDGERLYCSIQAYDTVPVGTLESHKRYADIQYVIRGAEYMGVAPLEDKEPFESHPDRDLYFYHGDMDKLTLTPGRFIVLMPQDLHAPRIAVGESAPVLKCVVKVLLD